MTIPTFDFLIKAAPSGVASDIPTTLMLWALVHLLKPELVVETGCDVGRTSHVIGQALQQMGRGRLVTCDVAPGAVAATTKLCQGLPVQARVGRGQDLPELRAADLVYFDSSFDGRVAEMALLKAGAVGVLHDWKQCIPDLPTAVKRFPEHVLLDSGPGLAIFRRAK